MVIPNGKVGRPSLSKQAGIPAKNGISNRKNSGIPSSDVEKLTGRLEQIEKTLQILSEEIHGLSAENRISLSKRNVKLFGIFKKRPHHRTQGPV